MTQTLPTMTNTVSVRLFAGAMQRAGAETVDVTLPAEACIADLRAALAAQFPPLRAIAAQLLFAIGTEYATDATPLPTDGEIVAFPPVSGG